MADYINFCCRAGGSNMNAGTVDGSTTEPATTPLVTYTGGDYNSSTDIYTAPVGANMTEAVVGRYVSIYVDGDVTPTSNQFLIGIITVVNAGTRQITIHATGRALLGTEVATGSGTRSMRIGGAWAGPSGASWGPFLIGLNSFNALSTHLVRINLKNDQNYVMTVGWSSTSAQARCIAGYASSYGDSGLAVITGPGSGASFTMFNTSSAWSNPQLHNLDMRDNGATGVANLISAAASNFLLRRCVIRSARGTGLSMISASSNTICYECEFYANNLSNGAALAGAVLNNSSSNLTLVNCLIHGHPGSNGVGIRAISGSLLLLNCIFTGNGSHGLASAVAVSLACVNCDFYNNSGSGIGGLGNGQVIKNCNFVKNQGAGVTATAPYSAWLYNNGFGSGTQENVGGTIVTPSGVYEVGSITYPTDVTPWVNPVAGDFRISLAAARSAGRGAFLNAVGSFNNTVGYPDIGAARA